MVVVGWVFYYREVEVQGLEQVSISIKLGDDLWVIDHYRLYM
jgi:hypothetical protein